MIEDRIISLEQRITKVEGILEQVLVRLDQLERRLDHLMARKADKWEIRIWFIILLILMAALKFV